MQEFLPTRESQVQKNVADEIQRLREMLLGNQGDLLSATRSRLARLAGARGVTPDALDDVVQETLLEAWKHLDRLYAPEGFQLWIDEICRNICRRYARLRAVDLQRTASLPSPSPYFEYEADEAAPDLLADMYANDPDPLEALDREELVVLLDRALGLLPQASRQMVELCHLIEMPRPEVAARLGISSGTLETRLHRARRQLRQILSGPLQREAEAFGLSLDEGLVEGWRETRMWCPRCARHRLQGLFLTIEGQEGPNLHLRCPDCSQVYGQDAVHSMSLVSLAGLHTFRPAWKRTMEGLTDRVLRALVPGEHLCLYCGAPATIAIEDRDADVALSGGPYPFWIRVRCSQCGGDADASGCMPAVDELVYWSHPRTREFMRQHPRWRSEPEGNLEHEGRAAIRLKIAAHESLEHLTVLADRQTLQVLALY